MAISSELSSDVAEAILAAKDGSARDLITLKEIVLEVHSTLQQMTRDARAARRPPQLPRKEVQTGN